MGFKCPLCCIDFGNDKTKFQEHIEYCNGGLAGKFVKDVIKTCESRECNPPYGDKEDCEFNSNGLCTEN